MPLVLASASPRRQELLKDAGIEFVVKPANIPEVRRDHESAQVFAERMAREKARAVFAGAKGEYVLGADTVVVVAATTGGETGASPVEVQLVLGKPENSEDAARMLSLLSGRKHQVITGVSLIGSGFEDVRSQTTTVEFSTLSETEIRDYIATGEPMDKAGAYAIQGAAARWVLNVKGDYSNVVGLPVALVLQMLRDHRLDKS
jgi:septum formation protein